MTRAGPLRIRYSGTCAAGIVDFAARSREAPMSTPNADQRYDRDFLLSAGKRNQVVELWEVEKYGRDCFNDPNHVHLYGMAPKEWHERGVRILARTCLEAVKDPLGNKIGHDI